MSAQALQIHWPNASLGGTGRTPRGHDSSRTADEESDDIDE